MSDQLWLKNYPVRWNLKYPEISIYRYLKENTAKCNDLIALVFFEKEITFRKMHDNIDSFAAALYDLGVRKGDRVAIMTPNCPEFVYTYYACMKLGAIEVQIDPLYMPSELEFVLKDSEAKVVVVADEFINSLQAVHDKVPTEHVIVSRFSGVELNGDNPWFNELLEFDELLEKYPPDSPEAEIDPREDVAVLQYTGGTTGTTKAAMLTHYNLISNVVQKKEWFSDLAREKFSNGLTQQYGVAILPLFQITGLNFCLNLALTYPMGMILLPFFDIEYIFSLIDRYRPAFFPGVPTIFSAIADHPDANNHNLKAVDIWRTGGAPMPVKLIEHTERRIGVKIIEGYGLTEASPTTHSNPFRGIRKFGSVGLPYPDTECRIVNPENRSEEVPVGEEGELIIKGPQIMKGYWKNPEDTKEILRDGWLYTRDIARMDESGFFYIVDREKDIVIIGGINVYPREVDEVFFKHPKVSEVVSTGVPDDFYGEALKTYVVLKEGDSATEEELLDYAAQKLAVYKLPRVIEFRQDLPKSNAGKILRRVLVESENNKVSSDREKIAVTLSDWGEDVMSLDDFSDDFDM